MGRESAQRPEKPPLQWTGILFALAANLLLPTAVDALATLLKLENLRWVLIGIVAPLVAGALTARYTGQRGAMHAFWGGLLSLPILGLFIFPGRWQLALFAFAFCILGGAVTELVLRRA